MKIDDLNFEVLIQYVKDNIERDFSYFSVIAEGIKCQGIAEINYCDMMTIYYAAIELMPNSNNNPDRYMNFGYNPAMNIKKFWL